MEKSNASAPNTEREGQAKRGGLRSFLNKSRSDWDLCNFFRHATNAAEDSMGKMLPISLIYRGYRYYG